MMAFALNSNAMVRTHLAEGSRLRLRDRRFLRQPQTQSGENEQGVQLARLHRRVRDGHTLRRCSRMQGRSERKDSSEKAILVEHLILAFLNCSLRHAPVLFRSIASNDAQRSS